MIFTVAMAEAIKAGNPRVLLVEMDHPSGMFRAWTGIGPLEYNGETWVGVGQLLSIAPVKATTDLQIQELKFSLSGVDPDVLSLLDENVRNRVASLWLACLNDRQEVIRDPWKVLDCILDYQEFHADDSGVCTVAVVARTGFYTLERALDEVWSPDNQKLRYPGDTGLDFLPTLQNQDTNWTVT